MRNEKQQKKKSFKLIEEEENKNKQQTFKSCSYFVLHKTLFKFNNSTRKTINVLKLIGQPRFTSVCLSY